MAELYDVEGEAPPPVPGERRWTVPPGPDTLPPPLGGPNVVEPPNEGRELLQALSGPRPLPQGMFGMPRGAPAVSDDELNAALAAPAVSDKEMEEAFAAPAVSDAEFEAAASEPPGLTLDEHLRIVHGASVEKDVKRLAEAYALSRKQGIPPDVIDEHLEEMKQRQSIADFDPEKARQANPWLAALAQEEHPRVAMLAMRDPGFKPLRDAWVSAVDWLEDTLQPPMPKGGGNLTEQERQRDAFLNAFTVGVKPSQPTPEERAARTEELTAVRTARDALQPQQPVVVDEDALRVRNEPGWQRAFHVPALRFAENWRGMQLSSEYASLALKRQLGQDTTDTWARIDELKAQAQPRAYGEEGLPRVLSDIAGTSASTAKTLVDAGPLAIVAGLGGAVAGGLVAGPEGVLPGARAATGVALGGGMAVSSGWHEFGNAYQEMTEHGIPHGVAFGFSAAYGLTAMAIEGSLGVTPLLAKAVGGLGPAIRNGTARTAFRDVLLGNASFREAVEAFGKKYGKDIAEKKASPEAMREALELFSRFGALKRFVTGQAEAGLGEAAEEGLQQTAQGAAEYGAAWTATGVRPAEGPINIPAILESMYQGALGGFFGVGVVANTLNLVSEVNQANRVRRAGEQVRVLANLPDSPTVKAAPEAVAKLVAQHAAANGAPVEALHVDPGAFVRFNQDQNIDPAAAAAEVLGPEGPKLLQEAQATGGKLAIPLPVYLEKVGGTALGKALENDTTTTADGTTTNEQAARAKELAAQVKEVEAALADEGDVEANPKLSPAEKQVVALEEQFAETTGRSKKDARTSVVPWLAFYRAQAKRFGMTADELFNDVHARVFPGEQAVRGAQLGAVFDQPRPEGGGPTLREQQQASPEFKNWFGDSKVTDETGKPLVLYHGTSDDVAAFDLEHPHRKDTGWLGTGVYLQTDPGLAGSYAYLKAGAAGPNVMPVYARLENPFRATPEDKERLRKISQDQGREAGRAAADAWTRELQARGHDGVILEYPAGRHTKASREIVVFDPAGVKSAVGNRGTFDPTSSNILYQGGEGTPGPLWYSPAEKAALNAKQTAGDAKSWMAVLSKTPGVKKDELDLLGLEDFLKEEGKKGSIPKQAVVDFIRANQVQVREVVNAGRDLAASFRPEDRERLENNGLIVDEDGPHLDVVSTDDEGNEIEGTDEQLTDPDEIIDHLRDVEGIGWEEAALVREALERYDDARYGEEGAATKYGPESAEWANLNTPGGTPGSYRELLFYTPAVEEFNAPHFGQQGRGLLAHARIVEHTLADGQKVLLVDEIQADIENQRRQYRKLVAGETERVAKATATLRAALAQHGADEQTIASLTADILRGVDPEDRPGRYSADAQQLFARTKGEWQPLRLAGIALRDYERTLKDIPESPFSASWQGLVVKRLVRWAAEHGYERIAWTTGQAQIERYNLGKRGEAKRITYDQAIPSIVEKLVKKFGGEVKKERLKGGPAAMTIDPGLPGHFDIYDASTEELLAGDFPTREEAQEHLERIQRSRPVGPEVWTATLPESLRVEALVHGMPLFQGDEGAAAKGPLGFMQISREQGRRIIQIGLNKHHNLSTFLHEQGHVFLELFGDLAERPDAPESVKRDFATLLSHFGVEKRGDIKTEHHELFARMFERYLMEGKAPSPKLVGAFERFRLWLREIYKVYQALRAPLTDEVRGVFDRMLATDEEIAAVKRDMGGLASVFKSAEEMGVTPEQYAAHVRNLEKATAHATRQAELRALKDRLREQESWWKEEEAKLREEAGREYDAMPGAQARTFLRSGKYRWSSDADVVREMNLGGPQRLDAAAVERAVGKAAAAQFPTTKEGGLNPDDVAEMFGFPTGDAMLHDVLRLPDRQEHVDATARQRMQERHPDVLKERDELRTLVAKGLHGDYTKNWFLAELKALRKKAGVRGEVPTEAVERAARGIADRQEVGRLNVGAALAAERGAAQKMAEAAAKGNYAQAYAFALQRLLNMHVYSALDEARELREGFLDRASAATKDAARAKLGKGDPLYRDAVDRVLEALGLADVHAREGEAPTVAEVVAQMEADGSTVQFDPEVVSRAVAKADGPGKPGYKALTVAELREVDKAVRNIQGTARTKATVLLEGKRVDREEVVATLIEEAQTSLPSLGPGKTKDAKTWGERTKSFVAGLDADLLKPEVLVRWLGGDDLASEWFQAIMLPLQQAKHAEVALLKHTIQPIIDALASMPDAVKKRANEKVDGKALFPDHRADLEPPSRRFELLALALNMGNEGNKQRLLEGRGITEEQAMAAVSMLTKEELDWVQTVWDQMESLWPKAAALEERMTGLRPEKVKPTELVTRHGTYRGGYYPAVYHVRENVGRVQEGTAAALMDPTFTRPGTSRGHLKARVEGFTGAIDLTLSAIARHLTQASHDISFREAVTSAGSLLMDPRIHAVLQERLGEERASKFVPWLKDVGRAQAGTASASNFGRLVMWVRSNTTVAVLGYSIRTALGDLANLAAVLPGSKWELSTKHYAGALMKSLRSPRESYNFATGKSGELKARHDTTARELQREIHRLARGGPFETGPLAWVKDHAFALQEFTDKLTTTPVWLARYNQALAEGDPNDPRHEEKAIVAADALIRQQFPSHSAVDAAGIIRDKGAMGALLMFHGYMNVSYNVRRNIWHDIHLATGINERVRASAYILATSLAFSTGAMVIEQLLSQGRPGTNGDDDKWWEWYLTKLAFAQFQDIPLAGTAATGAEAMLKGGRSMERASPAVEMLKGAVSAYQTLGKDEKDLWEKANVVYQALGPLLGLPTSAPLRASRYLHDLFTSDIAPEASDVPKGLIYGPPRKGATQR